jgi:hypothetical protein
VTLICGDRSCCLKAPSLWSEKVGRRMDRIPVDRDDLAENAYMM